MTEDVMIGWHHRLSVQEFEQAPGDSEGQGNLVCCSPWGPKDVTEQPATIWCSPLQHPSPCSYVSGERP